MNLKKKIAYFFLVAVTLTVMTGAGAVFMRGGDFLLTYIADALGVGLTYKGRCSFFDAFVFRSAAVGSFEIRIPETPMLIESGHVRLYFDYRDIPSKRAIRVRALLEEPVFHITEGGDGRAYPEVDRILGFLPPSIAAVNETLDAGSVRSIYCDLLLYGDTVELDEVTVVADLALLTARGKANKAGQFKVSLDAFFSPALLGSLPKETHDLFLSRRNGWGKLVLSVENDPARPFFKLESGPVRFVMGEGVILDE